MGNRTLTIEVTDAEFQELTSVALLVQKPLEKLVLDIVLGGLRVRRLHEMSEEKAFTDPAYQPPKPGWDEDEKGNTIRSVLLRRSDYDEGW